MRVYRDSKLIAVFGVKEIRITKWKKQKGYETKDDTKTEKKRKTEVIKKRKKL